MTELDLSRRAWQKALAEMKYSKPTYKVSLLWVILDGLDHGVGNASSIPIGRNLSKAFDALLARHDALQSPGAYRQPLQFLSTASGSTTTDRIWELDGQEIRPLLTYRSVLANPIERDWLREQLRNWLRNQDQAECVRLLEEVNLKGKPWSESEIQIATSAYLKMLLHELRGESYVKTQFNREFREQFPHRSSGSVEFKFANISAILEGMGCPTVAGYKPRSHVQGAMKDHLNRLLQKPDFHNLLQQAGQALEVLTPAEFESNSFAEVLVPPPDFLPLPPGHNQLSEDIKRKARHVDFAAREAANRALGQEGERFVFEYEQWKLRELGRDDLAGRVEWIARDRGDGAGYDILSFDPKVESEQFLEVKTTVCGAKSRFFASRNEVNFSEEFAEQFHLCRVYGFRTMPRMFELAGSLRESCRLESQTYSCRPQ